MGKRNTLKIKILFSIGLTIFLTLGTSTVTHVQDLKKNYLEAIEWRSDTLAQSLGSDIRAKYSFFGETADSALILEAAFTQCKKLYEANRDKNVSHVSIINESGVIVAHNDRSLRNTPLTSPELLKDLKIRKVLTVLDQESYHTLIPITTESGVYLATIDIGIPKKIVDEKIRAVILQAVYLFIFFLSLACFPVWFFVKRFVTQPISQLTEATVAIADGDLEQEIDVIGASEFKTFSVSLMNMRNAIRKSIRTLSEKNRELSKEIVRRKNVESELEKNRDKLEDLVEERTADLAQTNKELEAFSYSVSHDLRAPLRAINGFSEIILAEDQELSPQTQEHLGKIARNARKMGLLVDGLLTLSRLNRKELKHDFIDMNALFRETVDDLIEKQGDRLVEFKLSDLPPCNGDIVLLRQVVANLLDNAFKYSGSRENSVIEVGSQREGEDTFYFVKDNGVGFDMRYVDKLFGVFQRLHAVEDFEGTGIGLALSQRIIHRHDGHIRAESVIDKGTVLYFSIGS